MELRVALVIVCLVVETMSSIVRGKHSCDFLQSQVLGTSVVSGNVVYRDGPLSQAVFSSSLGGIRVDGQGNILIVDVGNNALRSISPSGKSCNIIVSTFNRNCDNGGY